MALSLQEQTPETSIGLPIPIDIDVARTTGAGDRVAPPTASRLTIVVQTQQRIAILIDSAFHADVVNRDVLGGYADLLLPRFGLTAKPERSAGTTTLLLEHDARILFHTSRLLNATFVTTGYRSRDVHEMETTGARLAD